MKDGSNKTSTFDSNLIADFDYHNDGTGLFGYTFKFKMFNSRYGFGYSRSLKKMIIVDCYHKKTKHFSCFLNGIPLQQSLLVEFLFYPIDLKYSLAFPYVPHYSSNKTCPLFLIEFDYEKEICDFIHQGEFENRLITILLDPKNPKKFASINEIKSQSIQAENRSFYLGQICNNIVIINKESVVRESESRLQKIICMQLLDGKLIGLEWEDAFHLIDGFPTIRISYNTVDFKEKRFVKRFEFHLKDQFPLKYFHHGIPFAWTKHQCFTVGYKKRNPHLYAFDIMTRRCSIVCFNFVKITDLCVDQDGTLGFEAFGKIYNYSIRKPQKLKRIIWFSIRRKSMSCENDKFYKFAMKQMPCNSELQPFNFS